MSTAVLRPRRNQQAKGSISMSPPAAPASAVAVPGPATSTAAETAAAAGQPTSTSAAAAPCAAFEVEQPLLSSSGKQPQTQTRSSVNYNAFTTSALSPDFSRHNHPLAIRSGAAFHVLLVLPLVAWWIAVSSGIAIYEGVPKGMRVRHVMTWFDKGILRPAGSLVPFAVLGLRAAVHVVSYLLRHGWSSSSRSQPRLRLGSLLLDCMFIYSVMAVLRLCVYSLHFWAMKHRYLEFHIVSDHIFLAATMLICLHTELACLTSDALRAAAASAADAPAEVEHADMLPASAGGSANAVAQQQQETQEQRRHVRASRGELVLLLLLVLLALFLYVSTAADMHYTAKYFHLPLESFTTTIAVFFMFQWPLLTWLNRMRRRTQRAAAAAS